MATSIGGLGSGLDTAALVQQLMAAEAAQQNQLKSARGQVTVRSAAWTALGTLMRGLTEKADALKTPDKLLATTSSSSSPTSVGVTSTATAVPGTLSFRVQSLATRHSVATAGSASATAPVGTGTLVVSTGTAALGATVTAGDTGTTGKYTVVISRSAPDAEPTATVNGQAVAFGDSSATAPDGSPTATRTLTVGGATLSFAGEVRTGTAVVGVAATDTDGDTLAEVSARLTSTGGPATSSLVDTGTGSAPVRMVLTATSSGAASRLEITASSGLTGFGALETLRAGANAVLEIGDPAQPLRVERADNTVSDLMPGVTLNLLKADPGTEVTVTVRKDDDAAVAKVKALTESLNGVLDWVATNTKYDVAAKKGGPMVGEGAVRSIPSSLFSALETSQTGGAYRVAGQVGLSVSRSGRVTLDETRLREALAADPAAVNALVSGIGSAVAKVGQAAGEAGGVVKSGQQSAEARSRELQNRIEAWDVRLAAIQKRYQRQFNALDVAMSRMNSQSSWLAGQIKSLPAG